jgi:hypothetical protein
MVGLAAHPSNPERLYCSISIYGVVMREGRRFEVPLRSRVVAGENLGAAWTDLSVPDSKRTGGLVVSPDGRYLVGSGGGHTWRLAIG